MENEKIIIELLQEIKQEQQKLNQRFNEIDKRLDKADKILDLLVSPVKMMDSNMNPLAHEDIEPEIKELRPQLKYIGFENLEELWNRALSQISSETSKPSFETWIKSTKLMSYNKEISSVTIAAPNSFARDWLENHYTHLISDILVRLTGEDLVVEFTTLKDC